MTDLDRLPPPSRPPLAPVLAPGRQPLSAGGWVLLTLALAASVAGQLVGYQVLQFVFGSCGPPPSGDPTYVLGQVSVLIGVAAVLGAWWLAAHLNRYRRPVLAAMFVSTLVGALIVLDALSLSAWSQGLVLLKPDPAPLTSPSSPGCP